MRDRGRQFRHQHGEATIADNGHDLLPRHGQLRRDCVRKTGSHRIEHARRDETLAGPEPHVARRKMRVGATVEGDDSVFRQSVA